MRKLLLLLCILSITISAKAQLFGKHYDEGAYYDSVNVKHTGLISWSPPEKSSKKGDEIYFKPEKKADRIKLSNSQIKSFVVKKDSVTLDSFAVSSNEIVAKAPFLQVMVNDTDTKLYRFAQTAYSGGGMSYGFGGSVTLRSGYLSDITQYYFGSNPNELTKLDKKNFAEVIVKIMADKPLIVETIKYKKLRFGDMNDLLFFYKYGYMPPPPATEKTDYTEAP